MKRPESRAVFASNGEGENVIIGYEYTVPNKKEQEAQEAGIKLAKEIGRERAAGRAPLKKKLMNYLVGEEEAE